MKITITIPVHIDEPVYADERRQLQTHIEQAMPTLVKELQRSWFVQDPRMLGTVCRFKFGEVKAKVE